MSGVILETDADRSLERRTIERLMITMWYDSRPVQMPPLSAIDYIIEVDGRARLGLEIKTRKESVDQIRSYGGLMLKHRKLVELQTIGNLLQLPINCVFAFDNAEGQIHIAYPDKLTGLEPQAPPRRRNYRGLACDEEPVVYLDWKTHLWRVM